MNLRCLQVMMLAGWLSLQAFALAQFPTDRQRPDHPSHRYLPPPVGRGSLGEQIRSLENLSRSTEQSSPAPLELSPAQLQQLDAILESFRGENGELNIPSPDQVPKQWIDSLLPDPKQRQQAKDMLEEYARSRQLPLNQSAEPNGLPSFDSPGSIDQDNARTRDPFGPNSARNRNADADQAEQLQSNALQDRSPSSPANGNRSSSSGRNIQPGNNIQPGTSTQPGANAPSPYELPKDTPPALRNLYETLKQFQQQRAEQEKRESIRSRIERRGMQTDRDAQAGRDRSPAPPRNDPRSGRPRTSDTARDPGRAPNPNLNRPNNPSNLPPSRFRSQPQITDNDVANGAETNGMGRNGSDPNTPKDESLLKAGIGANPQLPDSLAKATPKTDEPEKPKLTPFDEGYDFSADQKVTVDPFAVTEDPTRDPGTNKFTPPPKPREPFNVRRLSQQPPPQSSSANSGSANTGSANAGSANAGSANAGSANAGSANAGSANAADTKSDNENIDWKKSVNDLGLGPALKRIVQKTLKEQGFDPSQPGNSLTPGTAGSPNSNANSSSSNFPITSLPTPQQAEQIKQWANSLANGTNGTNGSNGSNGSSTSSNSSRSSSNSQWGKWMGDVWRAMAEAPSRSNPSSSSAAVSPAAVGGSFSEFRWTNSMSMALLVFAALILLIVWFSRQRVAELSDASAAQAEWVRTVIAQGLKTRADVVRAFHQLVKQSRAVSDWWTHRSIVKHFNTQTPQLASAISELAVVYEQARYYPEDVELSPQQLAQVRALLESVKIPTTVAPS